MTFRSRVLLRGVNPYVLVDERMAVRLRKGWRKAMPVKLKVGYRSKQQWRTNLMPVGDGSFYLYLHGEIRRASGLSVGDEIVVQLVFDRRYQSGPAHPIPPLFRRELKANHAVRRAWSALAPSRRKEILRYLAGLKTSEARDRNIRTALAILAGAKRRFLGRAWNR